MPEHAAQGGDPAPKPVKPQPTLEGFFGWAFNEYVSADGKKPGPVAAQMIEDWLRRNAKMLADDYEITRDRYRRETGQGAPVAHLEAHRVATRREPGGRAREGEPK
jgi:hypothetical protein